MKQKLATTKYFSAKRVATLAVLCAMGLIMFMVESLFPPLFLPGAKMGLSNIFSLLTLFLLGPIDAFILVVVRVVLGSMFTGNMSTLMYSLTAGVVSVVVSSILVEFAYPKVSIIAISIVSAVLHNLTQNVVFCLVSDTPQMFSYMPWLALLGVLAGVIVGAAVWFMLRMIPTRTFATLLDFNLSELQSEQQLTEQQPKIVCRAVIFDLDGVLVHTDEYHYLAWKSLADELDVYFDRTINNRLRGVSRMDSLEIVLENASVQYSDEEKKRLASIKNDRYVELLDNMSPESVDSGVLSALGELKAMGLKLAIGSSSKNSKLILQKTGLDKYFDAVSDGNNITKSKPDPEVFVKAAQFIGEDVCNCVVVEDARSGIDAAKNGDFVAIGIGDAANYEHTDYAISSLADLVELLKQ